jgi:hypothetical protein
MNAINWLDRHNGTAWVYGMKYRPPAPGFTCPRDGFLMRLDGSPESQHQKYLHGVIYYDRELPATQAEAFDLDPIGTIQCKWEEAA